MVRTKADNSARKAVAAKAPRKALAPTGGSSLMSPKSGGKKDRYGGGNTVCPQPTPDWQKSVSMFFTKVPSTSSGKENEDPEDGPSSSKDLDRTETAGSSSSGQSLRAEDKDEEMDDGGDEQEEREEEEEEDEEGDDEPAASSSSSDRFQRNNCISDSDDD
ncbi:PCNA-associated factor-like [Diadema setosum]|uniref:PCNA-associated factor-like n=1 Tax=Diadema setosum TaxID=31175 RepID=UPI003B3A4BC8